jgi:hypothetical protein
VIFSVTEVVQAGQVGRGRLDQRSGPGDQVPGADLALAGGDPRAAGVLVPGRRGHLVPEPDQRAQPVVVGDIAQVAAQLGLGGEGLAPVGLGREGERVQVGLDVAAAAGVGVVPPGPADVGGPLQQHQVAVSGPAQRDGGAQAGEPGADDGDHHVAGGHLVTPFLAWGVLLSR